MRIWLSFDHHAADGRVWAIRAGNQWRRVKAVQIGITMHTVYKGPKAAQPRAYLVGDGEVVEHSGVAYLKGEKQ